VAAADSSTSSALPGIVEDVEDFAACYRSEKLPLVRFLMNHGATQHEAHDIAQETFTQAWQHWSSIRAPRAWLRTVALREFYRGLHGVRLLLTPSPTSSRPGLGQRPWIQVEDDRL